MSAPPASLLPQADDRRARASLATWFVAMWIAWAVLLATAMVLGEQLGHASTAATAARMGSSVVLVATAWLAYGVFRARPVGVFAICVAFGMTLGAIGDFFNAGLLDFVPLSSGVLGGIAAFGLGHVAYIAGSIDLAWRARLANARAMAGAIIAWQAVAIVAWYFVVLLGSEARELICPALGYTLLLAGTAGVATGLALQDRRLLTLAIGAALFLISDLILAFGMFQGSFEHQTECVWLTYGPGQMLIVFSTIQAAVVLRQRTVA
jgi:YhhN family